VLVVAIFEPISDVLTALPAVKVYLVRRYIGVMIAFFLTSLATPALSDAMRGYPSIGLRYLLIQCGNVNDDGHFTRDGMDVYLRQYR
jgi:hypothetical protein